VKAGKLELNQIESLLNGGLGALRKDVVFGPAVGLDCGIVDVGHGMYGVLKSDPITFATDRIGWYAVNVNANDIATAGAMPQWFLSTILLPESSRVEDVNKVCSDLHDAACEIGVSIVGGHTEVTSAVNQVVVSGTMIGLVKKEELIHPANIKQGHVLVVTKGAAIEATAIAAFEKAEEVSRAFGDDFQKKAAAYLDYPGISIIREAQIFKKYNAYGMHDTTEGGVRAAVYEIAKASGLSVTFNSDLVPVSKITASICAHFGMDPLGAIGSGSLISAMDKNEAEKALLELDEIGVAAVIAGTFGEACKDSVEIKNGEVIPLVYNPCDEITKLF